MSDHKNDKDDLKPSDYILDDFLSDNGWKVPFDIGREFLAELREAFRREEDDE